MYCTNCGEKFTKEYKYCPNCGNKIETTNITYSDSKIEDEKQANILCVISLILTFGSSLLDKGIDYLIPNNYSSVITSLGPLSGLVLMIIARVKYPKSVFAKVLMWVYIVLILLAIIAFIVLVVSCFYACSHMDTSGCG